MALGDHHLLTTAYHWFHSCVRGSHFAVPLFLLVKSILTRVLPCTLFRFQVFRPKFPIHGLPIMRAMYLAHLMLLELTVLAYSMEQRPS